MALRTDLALESAQAVKPSVSEEYPGIKQQEFEKAQCKIIRTTIETSEAAQAISKAVGEYVTIETDNASGLDAFPEYFDEQVELLAEEINRIAGKKGKYLVIGLGNDDITPDALGPLVAKQIFATRHIPTEMPGFEEFSELSSVACIAPGVLGETGIEVAEITKAVCEKIKPELVIVIDALACAEISRLGNTIQITNTGISPGSGVKNSRKELSKATLDVPVIALGVPTVVDMNTIAEAITGKPALKKEYSDVMVTPRSVDKLIERSANLIAMGINRAIQPTLTIEDITSLI